MKRAIILTVALLLSVAIVVAAQPWQQKYEGDRATGPDVVAFWSFDGDVPQVDATESFKLRLRGSAKIVEGGKFGNCLESFLPKEDMKNKDEKEAAQGAQIVTKKPGEITPEGPFTVELWVKPKEEIRQVSILGVIDCKYVFYKHKSGKYNEGFGLYLQKRPGQDMWRGHLGLGFGEDSEYLFTQPFKFEPGTWYHLAFTYDGAGTVAMYVDGVKVGGKTSEVEGRKGIAPAKLPLVIGDRYGSLYYGFPGYIDQVRISKKVVEFKAD